MSDGTKIEWTDATVNAVNGCSVVSPGCTNCYAMRLAGTRMKSHPSRIGLTQDSKAGPVWTGEVRLSESALMQPLRWKRPRRIFWNAHGDLFHPAVPDEWIDRVFAVCALTPQHTHQILTKRPERMREYLCKPDVSVKVGLEALGLCLEHSSAGMRDLGKGIMLKGSDINPGALTLWPLPNVWLGTSVEDQQRANERIPYLLETPAAVRFLSMEPLLGPIDLTMIEFPNERGGMECYDALDLHGLPEDSPGCRALIEWIIVGGESGPGARPMHPDWVRSIRDQCAVPDVPFFFKQWGEWLPGQNDVHPEGRSVAHWQDGGWGHRDTTRKNYVTWDDTGVQRFGFCTDHRGYFSVKCWAQRVGKKAAARLLDGVQHDAMPTVQNG